MILCRTEGYSSYSNSYCLDFRKCRPSHLYNPWFWGCRNCSPFWFRLYSFPEKAKQAFHLRLRQSGGYRRSDYSLVSLFECKFCDLGASLQAFLPTASGVFGCKVPDKNRKGNRKCSSCGWRLPCTSRWFFYRSCCAFRSPWSLAGLSACSLSNWTSY